MYGRIRQLRGLYVEDFVSIAEALGEKPGNLLPNELGDVSHLKPLPVLAPALPRRKKSRA